MPRTREPGFNNRLRWFRRVHAAPWVADRFHDRPTMAAVARRIGVTVNTYKSWEIRGATPNVAKLEAALQRIEFPKAGEWAGWLITGMGQPPSGEGPNAEFAPVPPAEPVTRGRAEQLLEETVMRALAALPPGAEEAKRILNGGLRVVRDARQLGLATIFIAIAALLAATSRADAIDSGSSVLTDVQVQVLSSAIELLREARRRLKRAARRAVALPQPPLPPSPSLSAAALYGSIISLDDVRALLLEPTYHARAKKTG